MKKACINENEEVYTEIASWFTLGAGVCDLVVLPVVGARERAVLKVPYA